MSSRVDIHSRHTGSDQTVQSTRAPDSLTTLAHFTISALMNAANFSGVVLTGSPPWPESRSFTSGSCMILPTPAPHN